MKKVLITGGSSGLGKALAFQYAENGYEIIIVGRDIDKLIDTSNEMNDKGYRCNYISADICDIRSVKILSDTVKNSYGSICVLINCAGVAGFGPLESTDYESVDKVIDVNLKGTIFVIKELIEMIDDRILNIISTAGLRGKVNESIYCASKFGLRGFTEAMQKEYENRDISFTAVYMGGMNTPFWDNSDHIKDKSRLKDVAVIAEEIILMDDGRKEIIIDK